MFKKLKSLFVVEDASAASQPNKQAPAASPKSSPASAPAAGTSPATSKPNYSKNNPPKGKVDEKFVNRLLGAIEENNLKGFDYLEYKQSLQNLDNVDMDEATKFKSALAMAKTMGATPTNLIDSANHYLKVLSSEEQKFLNAFKHQREVQVSGRNADIKKLEDGIAQRKAQIDKLKKEIEAGEKALEEKKGSINQANAKVEATKDGFYHAYHIVTSQISEDIEKMKTYLS